MISAMEQAHSSLSCAALNKRERDVVFLAIKGFTNKAIARELNITEGTVKVHVKHIMEKLGANDRTQAITIAVRRGIIHL